MDSGQRRRRSLLAIVIATVIALFGASVPAHADPNSTDDEGGTATLREKLEDASKSYYTAKAALTKSQKRQAEITKQLRESELSLTRLGADVARIAAARYKGGDLGRLNGLLVGQGNPDALLQSAAVAQYLIWKDDVQLRQFRETRDKAKRQQAQLNAEIANERKQVGELDKQKRAAEKALAAVGGMVSAGYSGPVPEAQPAPRTRDGGWPSESCSINDPTSGGCLTPRMFHALNEARLAGFSRYTHCWRTQTWGEHPRGRACDFAAEKGGFGGAATGSDKTYGNRLAAWCKTNAEALGVLYVIWYRQIWMPGIGWRTYSGYGDPSSEHTNHIHLSMI